MKKRNKFLNKINLVIVFLFSFVLIYSFITISTQPAISGKSIDKNESESGALRAILIINNIFQIFKSNEITPPINQLMFDESSTKSGTLENYSIYVKIKTEGLNLDNLSINLFSEGNLIKEIKSYSLPDESKWIVRKNPDYPRYWYAVSSSEDGKNLGAIIRGIEGTGSVYISKDYGKNWEQVKSYADFNGIDYSFDGKNIVVISDDTGELPKTGGYIYTSNDFGQTWNQRGEKKFWQSVAVSKDGKKIIALDKEEGVYISKDNGINWMKSDIKKDWNSVCISDDAKIIAATTSNDKIYISEDYGKSFNHTGKIGNWRGISCSKDGNEIFVVEKDGSIYSSKNLGKDWETLGEKNNWIDIVSSEYGKMLVALDNGGEIYASNDQGNTWIPVSKEENWKSVAISSDGRKIIVAGDSLYTNSDTKVNDETTFQGLIDGNYQISANGYDKTGNSYKSEIRQIYINHSNQSNNIISSNLENCGEIASTGNYELQKDIYSAETCIKISSSDVTLNCKNHQITFNQDNKENTSGIIIIGKLNNILIKNCFINSKNIKMTSYAITSSSDTTNIILFNNTIENNGIGINIQGNSINISNNNIHSRDIGIFSESLSKSNIDVNNISENNYGIKINRLDLSKISNNKINATLNSFTNEDGNIANSIFSKNDIISGEYDLFIQGYLGKGAKNLSLIDQQIKKYYINITSELKFINSSQSRYIDLNLSGFGEDLFGSNQSKIDLSKNYTPYNLSFQNSPNKNCFDLTSDIIKICNCQEFQKINEKLDGIFEIPNDINCKESLNWNNGTGFILIGNSTNPFIGKIYGDGKIIDNIFINKSKNESIGLFDFISNASIENLGLTNLKIIGSDEIGLVGEIKDSEISNSFIQGNITSGKIFIKSISNHSVINSFYFNGSIIQIKESNKLDKTVWKRFLNNIQNNFEIEKYDNLEEYETYAELKNIENDIDGSNIKEKISQLKSYLNGLSSSEVKKSIRTNLDLAQLNEKFADDLLSNLSRDMQGNVATVILNSNYRLVFKTTLSGHNKETVKSFSFLFINGTQTQYHDINYYDSIIENKYESAKATLKKLISNDKDLLSIKDKIDYDNQSILKSEDYQNIISYYNDAYNEYNLVVTKLEKSDKFYDYVSSSIIRIYNKIGKNEKYSTKSSNIFKKLFNEIKNIF